MPVIGGEGKRIIQVYTDRYRPGTAADFASRPPTIEVTINEDRNVYRALLDTGAENTSMDLRIAERMKIKQFSEGHAHAITGNAKISIVRASVNIIGANVKFDCFPRLTDSDGMRECFDLILGRSFLQHCKFQISGQRYYLEWIG